VSRSTRLLLLLQNFTGRRRPVTAAQLAAELQVSERTVYRDLSELASQGVRLEGEAGLGYVLKPGFFLPPLMLTEEEVEAVLLGLSYVNQRGDEVLTRAALSARAKITSVLSQHTKATIAAPLVTTGPSGPAFPENPVSLTQLRAVIREQKKIEIGYLDGEGRSSHRTVWPIQLSFMDSARVLVAWCELRQAFRFFRTDRILSASEGGHYPKRRADLLREYRAQNNLDE
jgi:predicted DNA-binding transcriptional regulator YafY